jgi:hypothetical protein
MTTNAVYPTDIKSALGNLNNDLAFVATLLVKRYLEKRFGVPCAIPPETNERLAVIICRPERPAQRLWRRAPQSGTGAVRFMPLSTD